MDSSTQSTPVTLSPGGGNFTGFTNLLPYTATLPVPNPTKSFWLSSDPSANPLAQVGSEDPLPQEASVVIIGSGITGCSVAFHLSRLFRDRESAAADKHLEVILLEARDFCSGATGRNGGHLTAFTTSGFRDRAEVYGTNEALRTVALENHTVSSILKFLNETPGAAEEVDLVQGGRATVLFTPEQIEDARKDIKAAAEAGVDMSMVEWLEPDEAVQRFGFRQTSVYTGGNTLWPLKLATKLYQAAKGPNRGSNIQLDLFTHTPVTSVETITGSHHNCLVKTSRGDIKARFVVHATNGYASYLLPHLSNPLDGIVPTQGQCIAIRGSAESSKWPTNACRTLGGYEYWFPRPSRDAEGKVLIILGGSRKSSPQQGHNLADDSIIDPSIAQSLRGFLPKIYPGDFEECKIELEWTGIMGFTRSGDPMVGPVFVGPGKPVPHQYISAGYSGHGMPRAFACAEIVAGMIDAEARGVDYLPHGLPEWMPRHMLTTKDIW